MVVTLGQQYNVVEKSTVILQTYINRHAGTPDKAKTKQKQCNTTSDMVVTMYCFIGYKDKASTMVFKRKIRTRLDLLSIPQSGGKKCQNV